MFLRFTRNTTLPDYTVCNPYTQPEDTDKRNPGFIQSFRLFPVISGPFACPSGKSRRTFVPGTIPLPIYRTKGCEATPSVLWTDFLCDEQRARSVLVRQTPFCPTARSRSYREGFNSEVVKLLNLLAMRKNKGGSGGSKDVKTYRYTFRLNEAQNAKFLNMLDKSGATNKSKFILSRIFG